MGNSNYLTAMDYAGRIVYGTRETLDFTFRMSVRYKDSDGCFVEAGVAAGAQIIALMSGAPGKKIYAIDSFCGLPLPSNRDDQMPGIRMLKEWEQKALPDPGKQVLETTGATAVSESDFWHHIDTAFGPKKHNVTVVKGWFEETVSILSETIEPIAILRLDSDLYNSTWVCLQHLFPKVIKGGCVIVDDWTLPGCRAACDEYFALIGYEPEYQFLSTIAYFYK